MNEYLNTDILLKAYRQGFFPMAEGKKGEIHWYSPDPRAIIPFERIKVPKSVRQSIKREEFIFKIDTAFEEVIIRCSERADCWISEDIIDAYAMFYNLGFAHSVETFKDGKLVGGLYGVSIGGAFFGESMFTEITNASKSAFYYLAYHLMSKGFILLDTQFVNPHTESLGAIEIPREVYLKILNRAVNMKVSF